MTNAAQPTAAQAEAGNYKKGHLRLHGLDISIETPKGRRRNPAWPPMAADYGDIKRTAGADGDAVDVFIGPHPESELVVVVDQLNAAGKFDEHKCCLGFRTTAAAIDCYRNCYTPGWKIGPVTTMTIDQFKAWLKEGSQGKPLVPQVSRYAAAFSEAFAGRVSQQTTAERYAAIVEDALIERYARNSPGQMGLFGDGFGGSTLRSSKTQQRLPWDESKHPRASDGRFGDKPGSHGTKPKKAKKPFVYPSGETQAIGADGKPASSEESTKPDAKLPVDEKPKPKESNQEKDAPAEPPRDDPKDDDPKDDAPKNDAKPRDLFGGDDSVTEPPADATPRERAAHIQKQLDADYEFARASAVPNAGEDLKGSARHNRNAWSTLDDAERDGTAAELVTREQLLQNEPHEIGAHIESNPIGSLFMHLSLQVFPPRPGHANNTGGAKERAEYLEAYRTIKAAAEKIAAGPEMSDPRQYGNKLAAVVKSEISRLRGAKSDSWMDQASATDKYNPTANSLVKLHTHLTDHRKKTSLVRKGGEFMLGLAAQAAEKGNSPREHMVDAVHQVMEGKSISSILGVKGKKQKYFNAADAYVTHAEREGGKSIETKTAKGATKYMVDKLGLRGVQWGNSVSDPEREHHAVKAAEALVDLADVCGLPADAISLGGKVGLAIGARGKGMASAHYEPTTQVINLTRKNGVGALAHEWGHAMDHHCKDFRVSREGGDYLSENVAPMRFARDEDGQIKLENGKPAYVNHADDPVWAAMDQVRNAMTQSGFNRRLGGVVSAKVKEGSISKNGSMGRNYWTSEREKFARSFERFVQRKLDKAGRKNTYLTGLAKSSVGDDGLWPTDEEVDHMTPHFEKLLEAYGKKHHGLDEPVKYSAFDRQAYIDRLTATMLGITVDQYAARQAKDSPGQMNMFDESKHPRGEGGEFASKETPSGEPTGRKSTLAKMADKGDDRASKQLEKDAKAKAANAKPVFEDVGEMKALADKHRGVKVYVRRNDDPKGRFRIEDPEYGERWANSIAEVKKWTDASDQDRSHRDYAENHERVSADPTKATAKNLRRSSGYMNLLQRHYDRKLERGEMTKDQHKTMREAIRSEQEWYHRLIKEKESGIQPAKAPKNSEAKPGDQLGLLGEATRAPRKKAEFGSPKAKQGHLIDGLNAKRGQMSLIDEAGAPDDMVFKKSDRFAAIFADAVADRYRVGAGEVTREKAKPAKVEKSKATVGSFGDRGRFVTTEDGNVIFIASDGTVNRGPKEMKGTKVDPATAKGRKRRQKTERTDKFTPKTRLDHALVDAIGDHPDDVDALRDFAGDAHKMLTREANDTRDEMRQLLGQFGINGKQASGWLSSLRRVRDYNTIPHFDEMADYAAKYHPELLAVRSGESDKSGDAEASLFARLQQGFPPPPAKDSPEVIDLALEMAGPGFLSGDSDDRDPQLVGKAVLENPDDPFSDFVPFAARYARQVCERYQVQIA